MTGAVWFDSSVTGVNFTHTIQLHTLIQLILYISSLALCQQNWVREALRRWLVFHEANYFLSSQIFSFFSSICAATQKFCVPNIIFWTKCTTWKYKLQMQKRNKYNKRRRDNVFVKWWKKRKKKALHKHQGIFGGGESGARGITVKKYSTLRMCKISCSCLSLTLYPSSLLALNHTLVQPVDVLTVLQTEM